MRVKIEKIRVKKRMRKDVGDIEPLVESMRTRGLINPITVTDKYELIAGFRRLLAAKELEWEMIDCHIVNVKSRKDKFYIEVDENLTRKNFTSEEMDLIEEEGRYLQSSGFQKFLMLLQRIVRVVIEWIKALFSHFGR